LFGDNTLGGVSSHVIQLPIQAGTGCPLEVISKMILRHQDLKTTQMYLGRISETEALRWMDMLHGK
jgi:hypothetical protein